MSLSLASRREKNRVKVYHMNDDGKWDDRGTRHVTVDRLERSEDLGLFVIGDEDNCTLLVHRSSSDEIYKKQEDAVISWSDPEFSTELALSFEEATGCSYIWDHMCTEQRNLHFSSFDDLQSDPCSVSDMPETSGTSQEDAEAFHSINSDLSELPSVDLSTLPLILKAVVESGVVNRMRVADLILQDQNFFSKLVDLFRICEEFGRTDSLHMIFKLVKGIVLLNRPQIFEKLFGDEIIMDVIGSLEYDPEVPQVQQHRAFLKDHVVFKEAVPIKDPTVLSKIHQTYRVRYIKDVILPRVLDEPTIANLNTIIHANNTAVVFLLKHDGTFIQQLFARISSPTTPIELKRNLTLFLQEFCCLSRSLHLVQQLRLFRDLVNEGIFHIITDALRSQDERLVFAGTDILILFLNQDPNLVRAFIVQQEGNSLLGLLVKDMITDFGEDMHYQFLEILRILLDSQTMSGLEVSCISYLGDMIIEIFYEKYLVQYIDVITASCPPKGIAETLYKSIRSGGRVEDQIFMKPEILLSICELLCFCVLHHPSRIKHNFLINSVIEKVLFLTRRREKYLVVAAVRFLRTIISRNDEHLLHHIIKNNILEPVVEAFLDNGNRYNLLNSVVLELLEHICKENLKVLILYIVNCYWAQLAKFEYLSTIHSLKVIYEESLENSETKSTIKLVDPRKRTDHPSLRKEVDCSNEDSEEEETACAHTSYALKRPTESVLPNGRSVCYPSFRPGSAGHDNEEHIDKGYIPRTRKQETSIIDDEIVSTKLKRKLASSTSSNSEGLELSQLTKKHVPDTVSNGVAAAAACSTCIPADSPNKMAVVPKTGKTVENSNCNEPFSNKDHTLAQSCSNCIHKDSCGEDCVKAPTIDSSSDITINGDTIIDARSSPGPRSPPAHGVASSLIARISKLGNCGIKLVAAEKFCTC
ncbi:hypothetical protein AAC387_Pa09g1325 [Persea americana]